MLLETRVANAVSEVAAAELAREIYGIAATAKALPGEYDDNFHLVDGDGRAFILKVMHPARQESFVDMQAQALRLLAEKLPQRRLPRVISTKDKETFTTIPASDSERRIVWMLSYVAGKMLAEVNPHNEELLRGVGRLLGEMDAALAGFTHTAAHAELKWDSARAAWIANALQVIEDDERRALVRSVVRLYEAEVTPMLGSLRRSVIYGDANDHNVLVTEGWPREACAVIDFGDMHYGLTVAEPAIAAAYAALGKNEPLSGGCGGSCGLSPSESFVASGSKGGLSAAGDAAGGERGDQRGTETIAAGRCVHDRKRGAGVARPGAAGENKSAICGVHVSRGLRVCGRCAEREDYRVFAEERGSCRGGARQQRAS